MLKTFEDMERIVKAKPNKIRVAVVAAHDPHTLEGVSAASAQGLTEPLLIGDADKIRRICEETGLPLADAEILDVADDAAGAKKAAALIAAGDAQVLMKGKLQTADLLREVVNRELGLLTGEIMSHVGLFQIPNYHKLMMITDGGMVISPDVEQKRQILDNATAVMRKLGVEKPKVAVLCATEVENPKMQASVDAAELKRRNRDGRIAGCVVEGPISFDLMYDRESAAIKGYDSPVSGETDICLLPDMTAGNLVAKTFYVAAGAMMAGLIVGAKAPIVLVSRGATAEEKYWSLVFAAAVA
ncbi:MAG: phosphate butyryltransferase [Clostridiales Family XIII bacterium]|jgi:phosphate butyryltransferase|nr:phosphate butyryltransferase [Clostridiales Family XIII bacterium]